MNDKAAILDKIKSVKAWKRGDIRAPHKPLLVLLAISKLLSGEKYLAYELIEEKMENLLRDFGPPRKNYRPNYPFVRLASDGIWTFNKKELIKPNTDYSKKFLKENKIVGRLKPEISQALKSDIKLAKQIVDYLLESNFPVTYHDDLLVSLGLESLEKERKIKRDPDFREKVLDAYSRRCAVCEYSIRVRDQLVGLEAAHIKWHQARGPSSESNGIALCPLHHKLLDYGAFMIDEKMCIQVSAKANGQKLEDYLLRYNGKQIDLPRNKKFYPKPEFLSWHVKEVFQKYG